MLLSNLIKDIEITKIFHVLYGKMIATHDIVINAIKYDSRKVYRGDLFVAIRGRSFDGHKFIQDAIKNGAVAVVLEDDHALPDSYFMHTGVVKIVVENSRKALAEISANYFQHPSNKIKIIGVTGTNGKTTTTHILKSIIEKYEQKSLTPRKVGLIGTIENKLGDELLESHLTTPESVELNGLFLKFYQSGVDFVTMEVSSHALHQWRVHGIRFIAAVFTNLTQDHLDYHGTMEEYFKSKKILFDNLDSTAIAISNIDDVYGVRILESCKAKVITYGFSSNAEVQAERVKLNFSNTSFSVKYKNRTFQIVTPLIGKFNVYNILASVATAIGLGFDIETVQSALTNITPIRGRFEKIELPHGGMAIIDYAHTPDALEKLLVAIKDILPTKSSHRGKIITVFGAGGNRDKTKRPIMGKIAAELSDVVIITSDNPRNEDPYQIMRDILAGIAPHKKFLQEIDRKKAIEKAVELADKNDIILISGKGHENYQIIGNEKIHFSDTEIINQIICSIKK